MVDNEEPEKKPRRRRKPVEPIELFDERPPPEPSTENVLELSPSAGVPSREGGEVAPAEALSEAFDPWAHTDIVPEQPAIRETIPPSINPDPDDLVQLPPPDSSDTWRAGPAAGFVPRPEPEILPADEAQRPFEPPFVPITYMPHTTEETVRQSGLAWSMGIVFFGSVAFMLFLGWLADLLLGTSPWGIVVGVVLGSAIGFVQFFRISSQIFAKKPDEHRPLLSKHDDEQAPPF